VEKPIEVRYAGVAIGRALSVGDLEANGLFLGIGDPMPVGTVIGVKVDDDLVEGRVVDVVESAEPSKCGIRIRFEEPSAMSLFGLAGAPARPPRPKSDSASASAAPAPAAAAAVPAVPQEVAPSSEASVAVLAGDDAEAGGAADAAGGGDDSGGGQAGAGQGGRRRRRRR
jgi:hypothetical protein